MVLVRACVVRPTRATAVRTICTVCEIVGDLDGDGTTDGTDLAARLANSG